MARLDRPNDEATQSDWRITNSALRAKRTRGGTAERRARGLRHTSVDVACCGRSAEALVTVHPGQPDIQVSPTVEGDTGCNEIRADGDPPAFDGGHLSTVNAILQAVGCVDPDTNGNAKRSGTYGVHPDTKPCEAGR